MSMMQTFEAIIVGGGPAGAAVARDIATAGYRVAIIERDKRVGQPVQCSGLVTERTLVAAGLEPSMATNTLTGAAVFAPSGTRYEIGGDRVHAYILDRSQFDEGLMQQALDAGVALWTGTRVLTIERTRDGIRLSAERDGRSYIFETHLVIGADGPRSIVADFLGLPPPIEILRARGADVHLPRRPSLDQVQLFLGERYAPGFFAWAIPLGHTRYRIGWGVGRQSNDNRQLERLKEDYPQIFSGMTVISQTGGVIPLGPRARTVGDAGMVVGDAAGQAKATSGGGLYTSLVCARHCAEVAVAALTEGDTSAARLDAYDHAWRTTIGRELTRASALRQGYRTLSDTDLEWGMRMLHIPGIRRLVDQYGDIDYPSRLASMALRTAPSLLRLLRGRSVRADLLSQLDTRPAHPSVE